MIFNCFNNDEDADFRHTLGLLLVLSNLKIIKGYSYTYANHQYELRVVDKDE
jgi:hypothetical protein